MIMGVFKDIDKVLNGDGQLLDAELMKKFDSVLIHLFCRLNDIYEKYPKVYPQFEDAKDEWLRDLITDGGDYMFKLCKRKNDYRLGYKSYSDDFYSTEYVSIPFHLLEDDWEDKVEEDIKEQRISLLRKEIKKLQEVVRTAPDRIMEMEKELEELTK